MTESRSKGRRRGRRVLAALLWAWIAGVFVSTVIVGELLDGGTLIRVASLVVVVSLLTLAQLVAGEGEPGEFPPGGGPR